MIIVATKKVILLLHFFYSIEIGDTVPTGKGWEERQAWAINNKTIFPSVEALHKAQQELGTSLGIVKPDRLGRVIIQPRNEKEVRSAVNMAKRKKGLDSKI